MENDKVWSDSRGDEIWCNGGHMIREGDTFHWIGYETGSGRPWTIKLYSSKDLSRWEFRHNVIRRAGEFERFGWAGRPGLLHNRTAGRYVIVFEADGKDWFRHKTGFASCDRIDGDYRLDSLEYPEAGRSTGDQSVYQEGDDAYLVTVLDSENLEKPLNVSLAIYKLSSDFLHVERKVFEGFDTRKGKSPGLEAPHIVVIDGTYYWFNSGLRGWDSTPTWYTTARSLSGPWSEVKKLSTDPASEDSFNTQHDFVFPVTGVETTTYVYVGDRYSQHHGRGIGRNVFLPLTFEGRELRLKWMKSWRVDPVTGRFRETDGEL